MHVIAAKALCFKEALEPEFKVYSQQVLNNAKIMCETILSRDIDIVSGKTENHIIVFSI